ncbi:MAG: AAA family ATPase, partial [Actinobacteria bacterium]|nr:AAA family ATPase [Actinomycetota bacterium]
MYLKSLTIRGFKSFARKTVLEFQPGITIIVGPNGSGKSNIADAVMWVLGEQSPLTLRGNRMEDIIFSGSASMKPVNMAEVVLALDNSNNDFQLDYAEINVSRNVVRGGDSEYRLNNSSCRLLDVQELLSDAGVGRSLNSVISQGQLDEVLTCTPEHRRSYIEEAGGLLKYRKRREKAERKLIRMDEELKNTNAVLREVGRQLRPLLQQAGRLEKYQKISTELKETRLKLDVTRLRSMQGEWNDYEKLRSSQESRLAELESMLSARIGNARELENNENDWRSSEAKNRESFYKLVSMHEQLRATFDLWEQKKKTIEATDRRSLEETLASIRYRKAGVETRLEEYELKVEDV